MHHQICCEPWDMATLFMRRESRESVDRPKDYETKSLPHEVEDLQPHSQWRIHNFH